MRSGSLKKQPRAKSADPLGAADPVVGQGIRQERGCRWIICSGLPKPGECPNIILDVASDSPHARPQKATAQVRSLMNALIVGSFPHTEQEIEENQKVKAQFDEFKTSCFELGKAFAAEGATIYVGSDDGRLYALRAS